MNQPSNVALERRKFRRSVVGIPVQAVRRDAPAEDPGRIIGLHVLNVSRGGIAAVCHEHLPVRAPLLLFFPPLGPGRGRDTAAKVVHCQQCGGHFAVGIAFEEPWPDREEMQVE